MAVVANPRRIPASTGPRLDIAAKLTALRGLSLVDAPHPPLRRVLPRERGRHFLSSPLVGRWRAERVGGDSQALMPPSPAPPFQFPVPVASTSISGRISSPVYAEACILNNR